jgi:hypothetical protein
MKTLVAPLSVRRNPIAATLERARTVEVTPINIPPPDDITKSLARFDRHISNVAGKITEVDSLRRTLLGIERLEREQLTAQITSLKKRRDGLKKRKARHIHENQKAIRERQRLEKEAKKGAELIARYCGEYKRLDLTPLRWRTKKGLPLLAIFSLTKGVFSIGARTKRSSSTDYWGYRRWRTSTKQVHTPSLPKPVKACFDDVCARILDLARQKKKTILLSAEFSGVVPLEAKQKIAEARKKFKNIFILAEVKDWKIEERKATTVKPEPAPIVHGDPLVVGWDGQGFWLITSFDTTSLECYIEQVHCAKQEESSKN